MIVRFRMNLGSIDAAKLGLDYTKCQAEMECEVDDAAGKWLVEHGIAGAIVKGIAKPAAVQGVPPEFPKAKKAKDEAESK